ncbi:spore protease YyaC [Natranaerobius trueperi]|uniref:Spore protease YyaC n=1 Tax=Natranaerobius trueperi TaxID=759412 RepID=A0A226BX32_9FIRM|nr:spore protease YyaC [Natranaerobius trueperi]
MEFKVPGQKPNSCFKIKEALDKILIRDRPYPDQIIVACIGTDRSTGDSLGPLTGTHLLSLLPREVKVKGTLEFPVHATNLKGTVDEIKRNFTNPYIIAIDACLGKIESVGKVTVKEGPVKPGSGVNKELEPVGDCHITGIVNVGGFFEYMVLQNTRLYNVITLSKSISRGINLSLKDYLKKAQYNTVP